MLQSVTLKRGYLLVSLKRGEYSQLLLKAMSARNEPIKVRRIANG
jgi:hypothetical protein